MAKRETWQIHCIVLRFLMDNKNHPKLIFQGIFLAPNWKLPALQGVWISLMKGEEHTDRGLWNSREAGSWLKTSVCLTGCDASDRVFYPFLTLETSPGEILVFILHVIFDCFLSPLLLCLILPYVSAGPPKSIPFLPHPGETVVGIYHYTACSVAYLTYDSPRVFRAFLTCFADEHWVVPAPGQSSTLTVIFSLAGAKHIEKWKLPCKEARLTEGWDLSLRRQTHAKSRINIYWYGFF